MLALLLASASSASAVILTGGPVDVLPGGGSCTVSGVPSQSGGSTVSCSGVNLSAHTKVYFAIRNDSNVNGNTMTGSAPTAASGAVFRFLSSTSASITYTSSTTISDLFNGTQPVSNRLVLTLVTGSASVVAAGGVPVNNGNGDIGALFSVTSGSFSVRADVQAADAFFGLGNACPAVYDPTHTPASGSSDISKVDVAFYYSDCGDGVIDSPEQCDAAGANGTTGSCCTSTCQFRASGQICRPGGGAPCDLSETCTGASSICPGDDAPINMGVVCRSGSGDVCDQNELCTGVPGATCPPDDAPGNTSIVCRAGSVGDLCDNIETCNGVPGATCPPDDAPGNINVVCRPGSGDLCDPLEQCTGIPGQYCPPDVVANPTTLCRTGSGDSCDPNEFCTAIPGQTCPANVVTPSGTTCRTAVGACDVAETCTGTAGQTCPANGLAPSATPCDADANLCTLDECDGNGMCTFDSNLDCEDGNSCTQDSCDPQNGCVSTGTPAMTCTSALKGKLKIKDSSDNSKDGVKFLWKGGPSLVSNMGDPTLTTRYELCIYDNLGVRMAMGVPPGPEWELIGLPSSPKGYKFSDIGAQNDGVRLIKTKGSNLSNAKVKLLGKGGNLPDNSMLPFQYPVTAQLHASDGMCWEVQFGQNDTKKNELSGFSGSVP
jgi:hypothetical protein